MNENKYLNLFAEATNWSYEGLDTKVTVNLANVGYSDVISLLSAVYHHIGRNIERSPLEMLADTYNALVNFEENFEEVNEDETE